jgi:hypothetical protein
LCINVEVESIGHQLLQTRHLLFDFKRTLQTRQSSEKTQGTTGHYRTMARSIGASKSSPRFWLPWVSKVMTW